MLSLRPPHYLASRALSLLLLIAGWMGLFVGSLPLMGAGWLAAHGHMALIPWPWLGLSLLLVLVCMDGLWRSRRARSLYQHFGCFKLDADLEPARQQVLDGITGAFNQGQIGRARRLAERWLAEHPQDALVGRLSLGLLAWEPGQGAALLKALEEIELGSPRLRWAQRHKDPDKISGFDRPLPLLLSLALLLALASPLLYKELGLASSTLAPRGLPQAQSMFFSAQGLEQTSSEHFNYHSQNPAFAHFVRYESEKILQAHCETFHMDPAQFSSPKTDIFLAANEKDFLARSPYTKSWEAGLTVPSLNAVYLYLPSHGSQTFQLRDTLAHELGHVVFHRMFPNLDQDTWLNEGLAMYLGTHYAHQGMVDQAYLPWVSQNFFASLTRSHLPFDRFLNVTPQRMESKQEIETFYMQGFSLVVLLIDYLGNEGGMDRFMVFLRDYGRTHDINSSLRATYGPKIGGMDDLQGIWLLFMT